MEITKLNNMKKIFLLFLILISNIAFSQNYSDSSFGKYDKMADLFNHRKEEEAKKIADELLSGKYGEIDQYSKFFTLFSVANYYYQKDDYQKAYDFYQQFLDFNKNENPKKIDNKKIYIDEAKGKLEELKPKISVVSITTTNTAEVTDAAKDEPNKTSDTNRGTTNTASDKTVTLTVSGTGKTIEEAKTNALRSAIEQAFGAFISSKTEILNDNLVKDEIVSIANGNVQKYDVVSQVEIPNNGYAITLSATVSIDKLTSFAESKGVVVEFKGGMFGATIKLQKLNEESEFVAIKNLLVQILNILESTYDYSLKVNEPKLIEGDKYSILFEVSANKNDNYDNLWNFFKKTIRQISLNEVDALAIESTGKKIWYLNVDDEIFKIRNKKSFNSLFNFSTLSSLIALNSYFLKNNLETVKIKNLRLGSFFELAFGYNDKYGGYNYETIIANPEINYIVDTEKKINFLDYIKSNSLNLNVLLESSFLITLPNNNDLTLDNRHNFNIVRIKTPFNYKNYDLWDGFMNNFTKGENSLKYNLEYKLQDLEKIESFKIEKIPFIELMNNYASYRE